MTDSPIPVALPILSSQAVAGGSEIYRIQTDGYPRRIWSHAQDLVYALTFDAQGRLLAGTGNRGNLYRIDSDYSYTRLLNVEPTQITGLLRAPGLPAVSQSAGNTGKVIAIGPELKASQKPSRAKSWMRADSPIGAAWSIKNRHRLHLPLKHAPAMLFTAPREIGVRGAALNQKLA